MDRQPLFKRNTALSYKTEEQTVVRGYNVSRGVCNMGHTEANSGGWTSCLGFTDTLGCGTWAGNISCENINWKQFLMYTRVALPIANYQPSDEELFGAYLKSTAGIDIDLPACETLCDRVIR